MKAKTLLISGSLLTAAWMTTGIAFAQQTGPSKRDTINPDVSGPGASKGGSQSERSGESGVPLPKGSPQAGTVEMGKSPGKSSDMSSTGKRGGSANIKDVQQALKDKGHDPGPVDGAMGARTREALKSFQSASNLKPTGTLDAETAEKLGVQSSSSTSSGRSSTASATSRDRMKSGGDTTVGKDTDQPNQTPSKMK
jgi:peptidoglycan hydrolase-like protein with peptidoglycan-binding domain